MNKMLAMVLLKIQIANAVDCSNFMTIKNVAVTTLEVKYWQLAHAQV